MVGSDVDVLVIGAGPTGLGAAKRLQQLVYILDTVNHSDAEDWQWSIEQCIMAYPGF